MAHPAFDNEDPSPKSNALVNSGIATLHGQEEDVWLIDAPVIHQESSEEVSGIAVNDVGVKPVIHQDQGSFVNAKVSGIAVNDVGVKPVIHQDQGSFVNAKVYINGNRGIVKKRQAHDVYEVCFDHGITLMNTNEILSAVMSDSDDDGFKFLNLKSIDDHFQPKTVPSHRLTTEGWFFLVSWEDGSQDVVRLKDIKESYPIQVALYAKSVGIDKEPALVWWVNHVVKKQHRIISKIHTRNIRKTEKFGITVPRTVKEALELDRITNTDFWSKAIQKEMNNVQVAFKMLEKGARPYPGYQHITCHIIFDVKSDGTRKARYVAGGHLAVTDAITYSSVVSKDSIRILLVIAALNGLHLLSCDIVNAYLNAKPREHVYFVAGDEFGENAGRIIIVVRALYGLKSSGAAFRSKLLADLREMGYQSTRADADVYIKARSKGSGESYYEYILCYVDDILVISERPEEFMQSFAKLYQLKNGYGFPSTFLGVDIAKYKISDHRGNDMMCFGFSSANYVTRIIKDLDMKIKALMPTYIFPTYVVAPLSSTYHPETDNTEELNDEYTTFYQGLVGVLRWLVEVGRVDLSHPTSILSSYLQAPRMGHLLEVLHVYAYVKKTVTLSLVLNPNDHPMIKAEKSYKQEDWKDFYPDSIEDIPKDAPTPRGMPISITAYVDADHASNLKNRRSHSGIIIFLQNAPVIWYSKAQKTVETSTHGSELVATRIGIELIESLRYKLRMFGVPVDEPATVYCDNMSVVHNAQRPESVLKKKHNAISYHKIRETVAAGIVTIYKIDSQLNVSDLLTKCLSGVKTEFHTKHILFNDA